MRWVLGWQMGTHLAPCPAEMANPQRFLGSSLVAWSGLALPLPLPWHLGLMFRTRQPRGLLLSASTGPTATLTLQVGQGLQGAGAGVWGYCPVGRCPGGCGHGGPSVWGALLSGCCGHGGYGCGGIGMDGVMPYRGAVGRGFIGVGVSPCRNCSGGCGTRGGCYRRVILLSWLGVDVGTAALGGALGHIALGVGVVPGVMLSWGCGMLPGGAAVGGGRPWGGITLLGVLCHGCSDTSAHS